jgi:hypothetical protein
MYKISYKLLEEIVKLLDSVSKTELEYYKYTNKQKCEKLVNKIKKNYTAIK